jgi:membrane protein
MTARVSDLTPSDWKKALVETYREIKRDNLSLIAAGVAFYAFLSIFPALAATLSIYGLVADPATVEEHINALGAVLPSEALGLIRDQLHALTSSAPQALSISAIVSILLALWSANKATKGLFEALSIVYEEDETRGFFKMNTQTLLVTFLMVAGTVLLLGLVAIVPAILDSLGLGDAGKTVVAILRWPLAMILVLLGLAVLYKIGPDRRAAKWRWVSPGAILAAVLWLVASIGLSLYVSHFGKYNETYGAVGSVVILLLWLFISAYSVLMGGELNASLELREPRDTTVGPEKPVGERGAYVADTLPSD